MGMVLLTALGVGGATVIGAVLGVIFKKITHSFSDIVLSFAAGVMLAAAVLGLILPSLDYGGDFAIVTTVAGIFVGALALNVIDKLVPHLHRMVGSDIEEHESNGKLSKVLLFVTAIANAFRKIVNGDGGDKQKDFAEFSVVPVRFDVSTYHPVQVGNQLVDDIQCQGTCKNARNGCDDAPFAAILQGRQNQTQNRRSQHDACSEGQDNITEFT